MAVPMFCPSLDLLERNSACFGACRAVWLRISYGPAPNLFVPCNPTAPKAAVTERADSCTVVAVFL